ncbi:DNA double-strand break repair nuclease NurA [Streptomyces sp. NBC_01476]|uniref:DNA double-strand break repair nuclease NurA n=1 Tax=Streptomyces sp. NBC_01476 TaxID=2903881 RepID=UPI002E30AFCA|nr:DNA double-strand break repair nuclease NurA [Streptomyces sp. NBC_01476]
MNTYGGGPSEEDYARLPEDLLADLLSAAPAVADTVENLLGPALEMRDQLREAALDLGLIEQWQGGRPLTLAAVDGGFAVERTVAVDIALSVAVGVEGFAPEGRGWQWDDNQHSFAQHVLVHDVHNERLARAGMVIQELDVIADTPHELRIFDGSHLTPVIQLNSALASRSSDVRSRVLELANQHSLVDAFAAFTSESRIIAMPKYNSSRTICEALADEVGKPIPGDDRYLTSLILNGGEYVVPERVPADPWRQLHIKHHDDATDEEKALANKLHEALEPLQSRELYVIYFRPTDSSTAYRIEVKPGRAEDSDRVNDLLASIAFQLTTPFVQEPYPQYLADVMAKSVGLGIKALQNAAQLHLTRQSPQLAQSVVHSYRTEGK